MAQLRNIDLFLGRSNDSVLFGVYKDIPVLELKQLILSTFRLHEPMDIIGVKYCAAPDEDILSSDSQTIIPLSYLSRNPNAIRSSGKYQPVTSGGKVTSDSSYQRLFRFVNANWKSVLIATIISLILLPLIMYLFADYLRLHRPVLRNVYRNGPNYKI
eukprot:354803_1